MKVFDEPVDLRVAFYCNLMGWPKRSEGGVRQWVLTMANALVERGVTVDVLSEAPRSQFVDEPLLDSRVGRVVLGRGLLVQRRLDEYVRRHPGVRLVAALNHYNVAAAKLKGRVGARVHVMLTQHENLSADAAWRSPLAYRLLTYRVRRHFNKADAVVTVSGGLADDLRDNFGINAARMHTIYNPAFRPDFTASAETAIDHPWLMFKDRPLVIAAGRLHVVKGFDTLLQAFARLRRTLDARLIVLGDGKERTKLEGLVRDLDLSSCVQFPGRVECVAPWMSRADLFVLSSRREGLSAVLIEALTLGLPVVSTRCPSGPEEILEGGRWGRLVQVGDADGLATAMLAALQGPRPDRLPLQARAAEFSLEQALTQYLELWRSPPRP